MASRLPLLATMLAAALAAPSSAAVPPVRLDPIAATSSFAVHVTHAGDARVFIAELAGRIHIWKPGAGLLPTPFLDISGLVDTSGDGGLFSVAFHPDYASNGRFFVTYTAPGAVEGSPLQSVIARYEVSAGDPDVAEPASAAVLIRVDQPADSHNNGQVAFGPDGYLYVGFGDGGSGGLGPGVACRSQLCEETLGSDAFHGSILRIDVDQNDAVPPYHGIPSDNPFAGPDGVADAIWAKGFRNPWRFSFDRKSGDLWIGDVGQSSREEVIREPAGSPGGANYGWPVMEGSFCHDPDPISPNCPPGTPSCFDPAYTGPSFEYPTGSDCSVTGGFVYRGTGILPLWGRYVFGDFCSATVWLLDPATWTRSELIDAGSQLISFGEDAAGELYLALGTQVVRLAFDGPPPEVPALGVAARALLAALVLLAARHAAAGWRGERIDRA